MIRRKAPILQKSRLLALFGPAARGLGTKPATTDLAAQGGEIRPASKGLRDLRLAEPPRHQLLADACGTLAARRVRADEVLEETTIIQQPLQAQGLDGGTDRLLKIALGEQLASQLSRRKITTAEQQ